MASKVKQKRLAKESGKVSRNSSGEELVETMLEEILVVDEPVAEIRPKVRKLSQKSKRRFIVRRPSLN